MAKDSLIISESMQVHQTFKAIRRLNHTEQTPVIQQRKYLLWAESGRTSNFVNCIINKIYFILFDADFGRLLYDYYVFTYENFLFLKALPEAKL